MWFEETSASAGAPSPADVRFQVLDERRTGRYTFVSMKALQGYFSAWLPEEEIRRRVEDAKKGFVTRQGASPEETRLQFLKKCEYSLVRQLRRGAAAA